MRVYTDECVVDSGMGLMGPCTHVPIETTSLALTKNNITQIPIGVFANLKKCHVLDMSSKNITMLRQGMFHDLRCLHGLHLQKNQIRYIGPGAFVHLQKCKHLSLNRNHIKEIQPGMWDGLVSLNSLYLRNNRIRTLQTEAFRITWNKSKKGLTEELYIDLSKNRLINIEAGAFNGLKLERLDISLRRLLEGLWNGISSVYSLCLFQGKLTELRGYMFNGVENLNDISLEGNWISQIEDGTSSKFNVCKDLWLGNNHLSDIRGGMWVGLVCVEHLSLSSNKLTAVRQDMWWMRMKNLRILWLPENNITEIDNGAFHRLRQLQDIQLWGNWLTALRPGMWRGLRYLHTVTLSHNRISVIEPGMCANLPKVRSIALDNNRLTTITDVFSGGYAGQDAYIWLVRNPIVCDSTLCWANKPEYQHKVQAWLRFCQNENETACYDEQIISEDSQCLNQCHVNMTGSEDDDADGNSDNDIVPDSDGSGDIYNSTSTSLTSGVNHVDIDDDDDDDDDDHHHHHDVQTEKSGTKVPEGILVTANASILASIESINERNIHNSKTSVSNISQVAGGDGIINKIFRMMKALLNTVRNFWLRIIGTK